MTSPVVGQAINRVDGRDKVTGLAQYAAEFTLPRLCHAVLVQSTIAKGRIESMDTGAVEKMPGVLLVLDASNAQRLPQAGRANFNPPAGRMLSLLQDDQVSYNGEPIAVVIAETLEQARHAAQRLAVRYEVQVPILDFESGKSNAIKPKDIQGKPTDSKRGDAAVANASSDIRMQAVYTTPTEHHNPMEPHATIAQWQGDKLTVYDSTQYISGVKNSLSKTLGISPDKVEVHCPFTGGGFGSKGSTWSHVVLTAMASQKLGRPVKLVLDRPQMFGPVGARPNTEQTVSMSANADGSLSSLTHNVISYTSMLEDWTEPSAMQTRMLYACENQDTTHRLVKLNLGTPTFMRAPGEASGTFALDSAIDELAYQMKIDPLKMRLANYAEKDPESGKPFSSKSLKECYRLGAERFGWSKRPLAPRAMRDGHELIGWGMATATYPTNRSKAAASASLRADGMAVIRCGSQDLGTGTYTIMTQVAADALGYPIEKVVFELGDSRLPEAPVSGGSQTTASVSPAVQAAAQALRAKLIAAAIADADSPLYRIDAADITLSNGWLASRRDPTLRDAPAAIVARQGGQPIEAKAEAKPGEEKEKYSMHAFGAVFVEVRVDEDLGTVRVPRVVAAYGIGKLMNAKTGHSQLMGGLVWGLGLALLEQSELDQQYGRYVNANLAEYHVPVNADVQSIEISVVDEEDPYVNPLGAKGIGEIGITGVGAAVANAVFHATGKRVRDLPITLDKLI